MRIIISPRRVKKQNRIEQTKQNSRCQSFWENVTENWGYILWPFVQNYELMCVPSPKAKISQDVGVVCIHRCSS